MLDENISPGAHQPDSRAVGQPLVTLVTLVYFPDLKEALKSHMHAKHRLGYAACKAGYYTYYQSLLPHADKGISDAFWNMPCLSTRTIYSQKHVVHFRRTTSLVCPLPEWQHMDSAIHVLSGCQCPVIRNMVTERHNIANRMILKEASEGSLGSNVKHMDVGSADHVAQLDLQITEQVSNRVIPPYLLNPSIPDQARRTSSHPDAILVTPCPANQIDHLLPPHIGYSAV
eukprot:780979-Pelagomonas_calceolata.AAC.1